MSLTASHFDLPNQATGGAQVTAAPATRETAALGATPSADGAAPPDLRTSMEEHQRQRIEASLARHHNNWASAARELGLHRANLVRLAKRLGLRGEARSPADSKAPKQGAP